MQLLKLQIQPMTVILMIIWLKIMKLMMTLTVMVTMTMVVVMNLMMLVVIFVLMMVSTTTSTLVHPLCGQAMVLLTSSCRSFFGFILSDNNHIQISFFSQNAHNIVHQSELITTCKKMEFHSPSKVCNNNNNNSPSKVCQLLGI